MVEHALEHERRRHVGAPSAAAATAAAPLARAVAVRAVVAVGRLLGRLRRRSAGGSTGADRRGGGAAATLAGSGSGARPLSREIPCWRRKFAIEAGVEPSLCAIQMSVAPSCTQVRIWLSCGFSEALRRGGTASQGTPRGGRTRQPRPSSEEDPVHEVGERDEDREQHDHRDQEAPPRRPLRALAQRSAERSARRIESSVSSWASSARSSASPRRLRRVRGVSATAPCYSTPARGARAGEANPASDGDATSRRRCSLASF